MPAEEVDNYLAALEGPKRSTLQALRRTILEIIPDAEEVISYRVPVFRVGGQTIAGFAAFKNHLSYLALGDEFSTRELHKRLHTHRTFDAEQVELNEKA